MTATRCLRASAILVAFVGNTLAFSPAFSPALGGLGVKQLPLSRSSFPCTSSRSLGMRPAAISLSCTQAAKVESESGMSKVRRAFSLRTLVVGAFVVLAAQTPNLNGANSNNMMAHAPAPMLVSEARSEARAESSKVFLSASHGHAAPRSVHDEDPDKPFSIVDYLRKNRDSMGYALAGVFSMAAFGIPATLSLFFGAKIGGVLGSLFICAGSLMALFRTINLFQTGDR
mmetsp:Transcript_14903/g.35366  ORF Transcript_14903/g.35366 Transcript_14903/m.35366 type:complete len:229 (-) Transcript_14903:124-810(-)|eukprot:CAMPEP_0177697814 /NCGR_PEP_ID=MMETSP0484_2-20121128/4711_1 /TAXON_ID=354590 /ORGANISM="Rhodomonas lens, Strain RHODO" /LENGTH=228 /DNA_ID=CAMNT_0019208871 /DNA_START=74 /DNA_END=760 /DNA_ORIENTATION=-